MKFRTYCQIPEIPFSIDYSDVSLFVGSCFSDNVGSQMLSAGFKGLCNPFGVLYNPISLVNALDLLSGVSEIQKQDIFISNDTYRHWHFHSCFRASSPQILFTDILAIKEEASLQYRKSNVLFLTFGSAYSWRKLSDQQIVGNCHKMPSSLFARELLSVENMVDQVTRVCEQYASINLNRKIVLTVSPVRYLRDGLINSNRSKARLLEVCHQLSERLEYVFYFPAFELINDELRDYRFFKEDMVHPTPQAVRFVWDKFREIYFSLEAKEFYRLSSKIAKMEAHVIQQPNNEQSKQFLRRLQENKLVLKERFPFPEL
jgi:hypothetical protein